MEARVEEDGQIIPTVRKQRMVNARAQLAFFIFYSLGSHPTVGRSFLLNYSYEDNPLGSHKSLPSSDLHLIKLLIEITWHKDTEQKHKPCWWQTAVESWRMPNMSIMCPLFGSSPSIVWLSFNFHSLGLNFQTNLILQIFVSSCFGEKSGWDLHLLSQVLLNFKSSHSAVSSLNQTVVSSWLKDVLCWDSNKHPPLLDKSKWPHMLPGKKKESLCELRCTW